MNKEQRYYYKVTDLFTRSYHDGLRESNNKLLSVQYKFGKWVSPNIPHTDLMVFNTLGDARDFILRYDTRHNTYVYKCKVKNPRKRGLFIRVGNNRRVLEVFNDMIPKLQILRAKKKRYLNKCDSPPRGTVFCSAVKLIERIDMYSGRRSLQQG